MTIFFYDHEDGSVEESGYETLEDLLRPTWTDGPGPVDLTTDEEGFWFLDEESASIFRGEEVER